MPVKRCRFGHRSGFETAESRSLLTAIEAALAAQGQDGAVIGCVMALRTC